MDNLNLNQITPILKSSGVKSAGIFGSYAKGEQTPESDVDLLIELKQPVGLFKLIGLKNEISKVLDRPVDLITRNALHPMLKEKILSDLKIFYEAS